MSGIAFEPDLLKFSPFPVWCHLPAILDFCQNEFKIYFPECPGPSEHESGFVFFVQWTTSSLAAILFFLKIGQITKWICLFKSAWPPEHESGIYFCVWQTTSGLAATLFFHKTGQNWPKNFNYWTYNDRICSCRFRSKSVHELGHKTIKLTNLEVKVTFTHIVDKTMQMLKMKKKQNHQLDPWAPLLGSSSETHFPTWRGFCRVASHIV